MPLSNYRNGFKLGHTSREIPILDMQSKNGNVFWVDSNTGSNGNKGTFDSPFATIDYAIGRCTASQGDKIFVSPGHAETIVAATGMVADIAGISIIGLGVKEARPIITFTTSTAASVVISAADIYIGNMVFKNGIDSQVTMLDCNSLRTVIDGCYFTEGSATTGLTFIDINGGGANECDGVEVINCHFNAPTAGNYSAAIELGEVANEVQILNSYFWGDFDDACIHNPTGKVLTNLTIGECTLQNSQTGDHAIELVSACTGFARNLYMTTDTYATTFDPGELACLECYSISSIDKNARLNPVVET